MWFHDAMMSGSGHEETHAPQQISKLFDHLVSERQERGRYGKAEDNFFDRLIAAAEGLKLTAVRS